MRTPQQTEELLVYLRNALLAYPTQRFAQIVVNASPVHGDPFYVEDKEMLDGLKRLGGYE